VIDGRQVIVRGRPRFLASSSDRLVRMTRRQLLASATAAIPAFAANKPVIGLELYSVREELKADLPGTLKKVAAMGYPGVEFFGSYGDWTPAYAKEVRAILDGVGMKCLSTHNGIRYFPEVPRIIELNRILGSNLLIMSSGGRPEKLDGWKEVAATLTAADEKARAAGMRTGYHNHALEFVPVEGKRPMEVIAANTPKSVVLQLDVGTCLQAGSDPIAWVKANPGRIVSMHLKDWRPGPEHEGYQILLGEGYSKWKELLGVARKTGGLEHLLVEQEGHALPPFETVERCLKNLKKMLG